eukprot:2867243-Lingulodinium_polyedra.AAC.1
MHQFSCTGRIAPKSSQIEESYCAAGGTMGPAAGVVNLLLDVCTRGPLRFAVAANRSHVNTNSD